MTHDPLCPQFDHSKFCEGCTPACGTCRCNLISKVRADTLIRFGLLGDPSQACGVTP